MTVGAGLYGLQGPMTQVEHTLWVAHRIMTQEEDEIRNQGNGL